MTDQNSRRQSSTHKSTDPDFIGAEIALRRAAYVAQKRAIATTGSYEVWEDGKMVIRTTVNEELAKEFENPQAGLA